MSDDLKLLDLDAFEQPHILTIKYKGVAHEVQHLTVSGYIERMNLAKRIAEAKTENEAVALMVELIDQSIPTFGKEELEKLPLYKLDAILKRIQELNGQTQTDAELGNKAPKS